MRVVSNKYKMPQARKAARPRRVVSTQVLRKAIIFTPHQSYHSFKHFPTSKLSSHVHEACDSTFTKLLLTPTAHRGANKSLI